ncbi:MAG TPA: CoA ester lyase [Rhizomicrobium sp.]|jgi:citrate lyase subunit beta/citryl-CoA lyase|nr:CoA ester lyase [Rhizomicrobium sp.]
MIRPRRSVLFIPGSNARALAKARGLDCDVVVLDLEDAVAPEAKTHARLVVCEAVAARAFANKEVAVRINPLSSEYGRADLEAVIKAGPDAIILPKVRGAAEIGEARSPIKLWAMIETPRAILHLDAIAAAGVDCLILGANDLTKEMRAQAMPGREHLWAAMSLIVMHARAHGIDAIDATFNAIHDAEGFAASCTLGRGFGFDGKTLIHPGQIEAANRIFGPGVEDVEDARRILAAFAQNPGKSVLGLDGRMVERLHAEEASRLLALAEAIKSRC